MGKITEKEFKEWLVGENYQPLLFEDDEDLMACVKVPKTENFDYLYAMGDFQLRADELMRRPMLFVGVYSKKEEKIYPYHWIMQRVYPNLTHKQRLPMLLQNLNFQVKESIVKILNDDRNQLKIKELSAEGKKTLENYKTDWLEEDIKRAYIEDVKSEDIQYTSGYCLADYEDDKILGYIDNPAQMVQKEAEKYIESHQEEILLRFEKNALKKAGLKDLEENWNESMVRLRGVYQAMKAAEKDTVTVTMEKYGETVQFRYKAERFEKDLCLYFSDIRAQYHGEVERLFSKQEGLPYENITEIVYENKRLYSAEPYVPEQEIGIKQTM